MLQTVNVLWLLCKSAVGKNICFSKTGACWFPGFESAAQLHMHPEGLVKQNPVVTQTQRSESAQEGLTTLSLEEKKIMLSLDRLNHQLYGKQ